MTRRSLLVAAWWLALTGAAAAAPKVRGRFPTAKRVPTARLTPSGK